MNDLFWCPEMKILAGWGDERERERERKK